MTRPVPTPALTTPETSSITLASCAHSATSSPPPRSASSLSSIARPASPAAMIEKVRKTLIQRTEDFTDDGAAGGDRILADLLLLLGHHDEQPVERFLR